MNVFIPALVLLMPPRAKAKGKAKAQPKFRLAKSQRQTARREAVRELNDLISAVELASPRLPARLSPGSNIKRNLSLSVRVIFFYNCIVCGCMTCWYGYGWK